MDDPPDSPKPNLAHMTAATVAIVTALALAGAFLPGLIYFDPCSTIGTLLFSPPLIVFALLQYRGVFRGQESALVAAVAGSFVTAGISAFVLFVAFVDGAPRQVLWVSGTIALGAGSMGVANLHWYRTLRSAAAQCRFVASRRGFTLREMLLTVTAICFMLAIGLALAKPHYAHQVTPRQAPFSLPKRARDVTYRNSNPQYFYTYTIDERSFLDFYEDQFDLEPIEGSASIYALINCTETGYDIGRKHVTNGWQYAWRHEDQGTYLIYDRDQQRVYYFSHTR